MEDLCNQVWEIVLACGGGGQAHAALGQVALAACLDRYAQPIAPHHNLHQPDSTTLSYIRGAIASCTGRHAPCLCFPR